MPTNMLPESARRQSSWRYFDIKYMFLSVSKFFTDPNQKCRELSLLASFASKFVTGTQAKKQIWGKNVHIILIHNNRKHFLNRGVENYHLIYAWQKFEAKQKFFQPTCWHNFFRAPQNALQLLIQHAESFSLNFHTPQCHLVRLYPGTNPDRVKNRHSLSALWVEPVNVVIFSILYCVHLCPQTLE